MAQISSVLLPRGLGKLRVNAPLDIVSVMPAARGVNFGNLRPNQEIAAGTWRTCDDHSDRWDKRCPLRWFTSFGDGSRLLSLKSFIVCSAQLFRWVYCM